MKRIYEERAYGNDPIAEAYWPTTVDAAQSRSYAQGATSCEFAIIGGGFTGLNAAIELANAGADVVVFEANTIGWGASGRNGGFCCLGGSKLSTKEMKRAFGEVELHRYANTQRAAIDHVAERLEDFGIGADVHSDGETLLAHRQSDAAGFDALAEENQALFGVKTQIFPKAALAEHGLHSPLFHGAATTPLGFALNPMKYILGLAKAAEQAGVRIFENTPVTSTTPNNDGWLLESPRARVQARKLIIATNGYSSDDLPRWLGARYLPVLSNILVSRVLSKDEQQDQGFWSNQMCYDSRHLLHYFRLMPNGRMLFGMRGSIRATADEHENTRKVIRRSFEKMFPKWRHVDTPFYWNGLICVSRNRVPFVGALSGERNAFAALCYHGNGVSIGSYSGKLVADDALGRKSNTPRAEFLSATPKKFELGRFRRATLPLVYRAYGWIDA